MIRGASQRLLLNKEHLLFQLKKSHIFAGPKMQKHLPQNEEDISYYCSFIWLLQLSIPMKSA